MSRLRDHKRHLAELPSGARRDLLRALSAPPDIRGDVIRQMYERTDTRVLAGVLIDLEADELIRLQVIALLEETT
jgi:hypothetical protein